MAGFVIEGLEDALRKMDEMTKNVAKKHVKKALRAAAKPVLQSAKDNAKKIDDPKTSEKIWKNISVAAGKSKNKDVIVMRVGIRGGASYSNPTPPNTSGGDTRYWRFVEFPTAHSTATPFMRPALYNNINQVTARFATVFNEDLDKELANL